MHMYSLNFSLESQISRSFEFMILLYFGQEHNTLGLVVRECSGLQDCNGIDVCT